MTAAATQTQPPHLNGDGDTQEKLLEDIKQHHVLPLWTQMKKLNPPLPNPQAIPFLWKYSEIRPNLLRAGKMVTEKQAERRVLMLVNPKKEAPFTTDTIYAGLQLVMPNETAPAHRHTAFAMRFIIEGSGGFTAVHGRRVNMKRGDVILTPTMNWHDHGKDGSGPMIWLDGLDLPNFVHFPVHFVEHHTAARYPAENIDSNDSPIVFPWEKMLAKLNAAPGKWVSLPYLQANGTEVSRILGGSAERLDAGESSPPVRETASSVYHVVEGSGYTVVDGEKLTWERGDTFCIPTWNQYQHFATSGETVYLYRFDDKPMLNALGFYRTDSTDVESLSTTWTSQ
ncbi:gentisate 1,2-dioxygenase [Phaeosphaeriaceae sp. PMI808]|nr:gentisate 1,2-dioxygenase [Phaeosphaeriaceae sp. PMI808]